MGKRNIEETVTLTSTPKFQPPTHLLLGRMHVHVDVLRRHLQADVGKVVAVLRQVIGVDAVQGLFHGGALDLFKMEGKEKEMEGGEERKE